MDSVRLVSGPQAADFVLSVFFAVRCIAGFGINPLQAVRESSSNMERAAIARLTQAWRGVVALCLLATASAAPVINEIMYRPGATYPENPALEFVEIYNPDTSAVDLSGWQITSGPDFVFPAGTSLAANGFVVVAADASALRNAGVTGIVVGPWKSGSGLSNKGERITLVNGAGETVDSSGSFACPSRRWENHARSRDEFGNTRRLEHTCGPHQRSAGDQHEDRKRFLVPGHHRTLQRREYGGGPCRQEPDGRSARAAEVCFPHWHDDRGRRVSTRIC